MFNLKVILLWYSCFCVVRSVTSQSKPNIVLFIADDLTDKNLVISDNAVYNKFTKKYTSKTLWFIGWNDVGFHGSNDIPTPNIDALAYSGLALHNYYVPPICTPSRAALMTGKYPIHTGMQHGVIYGAEPRGLPLSEKLLPQYLRELGYRTHLVGKWHLGHYKREYLPLNRGFESHTGFWAGKIDMYDHTNMEQGSWGFDFRRGFQVAHDLFGQYATDVYTKEAVKVIKGHKPSSPLFLMVSHSAVHSGNPAEFLRAPDRTVHKYAHIEDLQRRKFAAMVSKMDESVGTVISSLQARGMLNNTVVIFSTDNGGAAAGFNDNAASNYPLKGVKNTLWEGGVRGAALLWSPLLDKKSRVATQRMHIVDWLPTLLTAAGADLSSLKNMDGINQWEALSKDIASQRTSIVHNIDDVWGTASVTVDQWKLIKGASHYNGMWDHWYGPSERNGSYNVDLMYASQVAAALRSLGLMPDRAKVAELRTAGTLQCNGSAPSAASDGPYLFNIEEDPCEYTNLVDREPEVLQRLLTELQRVNATAMPPNARPLEARGDPALWGRVYTNFADYNISHQTCL